VKVCIVTELHALPIGGLIGHQDKGDCQFIKCNTVAISLLKTQAGTVYDGRVSRVKRKGSPIYRIQCGRIVDRFGTVSRVVLGLGT
jgi:hypothetical protein